MFNSRPSNTGIPSRPNPAQRPHIPGNTQPKSSAGRSWTLQPCKAPDNSFIFGNIAAVSPSDFPPPPDRNDIYLLINGTFVLSARPSIAVQPGTIGLSEPQRSWMSIAFLDQIRVEIYNPFDKDRSLNSDGVFLGSASIEVGFASAKKSTPVPYDQDKLSEAVTRRFQNQILAPGQRFLMDYESIPLNMTVKTVQLVDLTSEKPKPQNDSAVRSDPQARGILTNFTTIDFTRDPRTSIQLKASMRRPAVNSIVAPDFKFEDMGIGGLDAEFSTIFRRAFASRIFPPGIIERMGIQHVKGILLYGPPGTGKTLIARQIGKMLNAREPKIINGPEVLNKFVGQSEENIRKLFADAEKEYKEKGDESELHIIIFDELDAVCKQRGSGAGGGTGVGDSVVNQLLSKLDGVEQLNNILLIGMTNRKDMIDDALLRPGRLEVHMEISLPDRNGRQQILKIHTQKMRENDKLDPDVDLAELAARTKNFSGAELAGLIKSAASFALNRHVKVGTMAGVADDVVNVKLRWADFMNALEEVQPAFGTSGEDLQRRIRGGIIKYTPSVDLILNEANVNIEQLSEEGATPLSTLVLYGPPGCGKTALATQIAMNTQFPFIKMLSAENMIGFNEAAKVAYIERLFEDAYKSEKSVVIVDDIQRVFEWLPVGPRLSNNILQNLVSLLQKEPPNKRRILIIATTHDRSVLEQVDVWRHLEHQIPVPTVRTYDELAYIINSTRVFSSAQIDETVATIQQITQSREVGIGVRTVLRAVEVSKHDREDPVGRLSSMISKAIAERR